MTVLDKTKENDSSEFCTGWGEGERQQRPDNENQKYKKKEELHRSFALLHSLDSIVVNNEGNDTQ